MMDWAKIREELAAPFNISDIKWRIQSADADKDNELEGEAYVVAYVSNRAIQKRFDDVFGPGGWKNEFKEWGKPEFELNIDQLANHFKATNYKTESDLALAYYKNYLTPSVICGISVYDYDKHEWITKWDGADETNIEGTKGGFSDSMKRAAYHWDVGRYLYMLKSTKAKVKRTSKYKAWYIVEKPSLPMWAYKQYELNPTHIAAIDEVVTRKGLTEERITAPFFKTEYKELKMVEYKKVLDQLDGYEDVKPGEEPKKKEKHKK